jgi:hypothetical protein
MTTPASIAPKQQALPEKRTALLSALPKVCVIAVATIAVAQICLRGGGALVANAQPEAPVSLGLPQSTALLHLAEKQLAPPDFYANGDAPVEEITPAMRASVAWATATKALQAEPLNARALRLLGEAADLRGAEDDAARLMYAAVHYSLRETRANVWLANYALKRKDFAEALARIDAIVRTDPNARAAVLPELLRLAMTPEATDTMVGLLASNPSWRPWLLEAMPARVGNAGALSDLYLKLMATRPPLSNAELKPYLDELVRQNRIEQAYYLWLQTLPEQRLSQLGFLYNGDFGLRPTNLPFDWVIDPIPSVTIRIAVPAGGDGRALFVEFVQKRVPFRNVKQMTLLPPGRYRLSGRYKAIDLANRRGMTWRIYCAEQSALLAETARVSGTTLDWQAFETAFEVPRSGCRAQWLRLELAARVEVEQEVSGAIWYASMDIHKADVTAPNAQGDAIRLRPPSAETKFERALRRP